MKRLLSVLIIIMTIICITSCTANSVTDTETNQTNTGEKVPENLRTTYIEKEAGRGVVVIEEDNITADWAQDASVVYHYEMPVYYDQTNNTIIYNKATLNERSYAEDGSYTEKQIYNDGSGYFEFIDDSLIWHNEKEQRTDEFLNTSYISNFYDTLDKAEEVAGFSIEYPNNTSLFEVKETRYYVVEGTIAVIMSNDEQNLFIGKHTDRQVRDALFAGQYENKWNETINGYDCECFSNGEKIEAIWWNDDTYYYGVMYTDDDQTTSEGFTREEITTIIMEIR